MTRAQETDYSSFPLDVQFEFEKMGDTRKMRFIELIDSDVSPRLAVMLTLQHAPSIKCDGTFLSQYGSNGKQFADDPEGGDMLVSCAKKFDPNFSPVGKVYMSQLAQRGPGDPAAWVGADARGHIRKVCEERGLNSTGAVEYTAPIKDEYLKEAPYKVNDKVVAKHVIDAVAKDPSLKEKKDLVEMVRDQITPKDLK